VPSVIFSPATRAEIREARDWYEARAPGLGDRFVAELDAAIGRITAQPARFPMVFRDLRRARLRRFPYGLFFRHAQDTIYVVACFHGSRDPRQWQGRL
jgi:plasmid stabilization system protein ParE